MCVADFIDGRNQGIPAVLLGVVALFFLPNRPDSTSYLNERERELALERMNRNTSGDIGATVNKSKAVLCYDCVYGADVRPPRSYFCSVPRLEGQFCLSVNVVRDRTCLIDLYGWCHLFRLELCPCIDFCLLAYHYHNA